MIKSGRIKIRLRNQRLVRMMRKQMPRMKMMVGLRFKS